MRVIGVDSRGDPLSPIRATGTWEAMEARIAGHGRLRAMNGGMRGDRGLRVLRLDLEFSTWRWARYWTYPAQLGFEEGLRAHGARCLTITTPWLARAREICGGRRFDQVWVEIVHNPLDPALLEWIRSVAPVRIGFVPESLSYRAEEYALWPELKARKERVEERLGYLTHLVVADERDAEEQNAGGPARAMWWAPSVPERFICDAPEPARRSHAVFYGLLYGERVKMLEHPDLRGLLVRPGLPDGRVWPLLFDALHLAVRGVVGSGLPGGVAARGYLAALRAVRRRLFRGWLAALRTGSAVVNLPQFGKFYSGRVVEAMAAGRPVVAWEVPERPRNRALFTDGEEILLYHGADAPELAAHLRRLLAEPAFANAVVARARAKLRRLHTTEERVRQILDWVATGRRPEYA